MSRFGRPTLAPMAMLALALPLLLLSACGRKGDLEPPPGAEGQYPRQYPNPAPQQPNPDES